MPLIVPQERFVKFGDIGYEVIFDLGQVTSADVMWDRRIITLHGKYMIPSPQDQWVEHMTYTFRIKPGTIRIQRIYNPATDTYQKRRVAELYYKIEHKQGSSKAGTVQQNVITAPISDERFT